MPALFLTRLHREPRSNSKAKRRLEWFPRWALDQALAHTVDWHLAWRMGADMRAFSLQQIVAYEIAMEAA